jgi:transposase
VEGRQRRSFTDDYRRQAVDLVASSGGSIGSVAKELGLRDSVLRRWIEQRGQADHAAEIARLQRENERLRMERDIQKIDSDLCWSSEMRFRFIEDRRADYPVTIMCDVFGVSRAGYYAWRVHPESPRAAANSDYFDFLPLDLQRLEYAPFL